MGPKKTYTIRLGSQTLVRKSEDPELGRTKEIRVALPERYDMKGSLSQKPLEGNCHPGNWNRQE